MRERLASRAWLRALVLGVVALVLSVLSWWELLLAHPKTQNGDGQFFVEMVGAMRVSLLDFHELPLWNPYQCGGIPLWDNPQGISAAPMLWALLPFGTTRGIELWYILHSALGFVCMWLLARHELKLSVGASAVASAAFAFAGVHNQHLTGGHLVWAPYLYYPLAILFWRRAESDLRHAVGLGAIVALTMHEGGTYPLPHLALLLGLETLTRLGRAGAGGRGRRVLWIARAGVVVAVVGLALGASRFLPVLDQVRWHTRSLADERDAVSFQTLKAMFLDGNHSRDVPGQEYAWTEYGDYVGPILLVLAGAGIVLGGLDTGWMLFLLVVAFVLMLGHFAPWAPAALLKKYVFPFKQMRVPSRLIACVQIFLAAYAGVGIDRLGALAKRWLPSRVGSVVAGLVLIVGVVGAADVMWVGVQFGKQFVTSPPEDANVRVSPRLFIDGVGMAAFIDQPAQHHPRSECWEEWAFERGTALWPGDVPQAKPAHPSAAISVTRVKRTQNTFDVDIKALAPSRILFNSSYDRGWRANLGTVVNSDHLVAVDVPAGDAHLTLAYRPAGLLLGFAIAGICALLCISYLFVTSRRASRRPSRKRSEPGGA